MVKFYNFILCLLSSMVCASLAYSQTSENPVALPRHFPSGTRIVSIPNVPGVRSELLTYIAPLIEKSISNGHYPGAVILAAHHGKIIYRGVFGNRRIIPTIAPMQSNTLFDLASLTKVVATTPAIMQLIEQGRLNLDAPVAQYWPDFAKEQKDKITVRELLTHTSGMPADLSPLGNSQTEILHQIEVLQPASAPGTKFEYSDINFVILGHLVEIISGEPLNTYTKTHVFKPIGMNHTSYLPAASLRENIAPTEFRDNALRWGQVHDPTAAAMGGISGNAGLFSDVNDLAIYAQWMISAAQATPADPTSSEKKSINRILGPLTIQKMTTPQSPPGIQEVRGLGWDIDSHYSNRGVLLPINSYGHTGWTGTSMWIDPKTQTWIIVLTSRAHPSPETVNQAAEDRRIIANIIAASLIDVSAYEFVNTNERELSQAYQ